MSFVDQGTVHVDEVLPADPLDSRPRLGHPITVLEVPNEDQFLERMRAPRFPSIRPVTHVIEALYGEPVGEATQSSAFRFIPRNQVEVLVQANPHLELNARGVRRLPTPHRPIFEIPGNFPWHRMRGVDWAAIHMRVLDDEVSDPTHRILAVAAHNGIVVRGFEASVRKGMLEIAKSARLAAWMAVHRLPCPALPTENIGSPRWQKKLKPPGTALWRYDIDKTLESPHYWWAMRYMQATAWNHVPIDNPANAPALVFGQYDARREDGTDFHLPSKKASRKRDLMTLLEAAARADVTASPRPRDITPTSWRLSKWGLVTFRLPDDKAHLERIGYCCFITPRGWRTLWADGRMLEWRDAMERLSS